MELESILLPGVEANNWLLKDKKYIVPESGNRVPNREVSKVSV